MNNKSTENLLKTDSIEEIVSLEVPTIELKTIKSSETNKIIDDQAPIVNRRNNFFIEESSANGSESKPSIPVPAERKFSLPPIPKERNGKDVKENCNQLTRRQILQSENLVKIANERKIKPRKHKQVTSEYASDNGSGTDIQQLRSDRKHIEQTGLRTDQKQIELNTFRTRKKQLNLKSFEANEETTSFISYEEKHEHEDSSEHSHSSKQSLAKPGDEDGGKHNKAFIPDSDNEFAPDEEDDRPKGQEIAEKRLKNKSKKKEKKSIKKSREKRSKDTEQIGMISGQEIQETYDFKRVIGVRIHETSALRFDPLIRQPRVRVSFYNIKDGKLLNKSNPLRNAVLNYEPTNVTFIQPILSNRCIFKESCEIECDWNDELLIINEDIRHIKKDHVIIFFEIVDILSTNRNVEVNGLNGWYPICWAFLKPGNDKAFSNIDKRCELQLYQFQRQRNKNAIIDEWKAQKRIEYPAYLSVSVESYQAELTRSISLIRPMSVLEEEVTGDICSYGSDSEDVCEQSRTHAGQQFENLAETTNAKLLKLETRLPGQQCKCPNRLIYKHELPGYSHGQSQYGSMVVKFNPNGSLLAFHSTANLKSNHEIIVINMLNLQVVHHLIGHLGIVYDIDWLCEDTFASVSSDRTAIIWFLTGNGFKMKVLPHPSFVYAATWLKKSSDFAYIATGGRDCVLRIWKISMDIEADVELCDELIQHENYITSLAAGRKLSLYTADWNGTLLEWYREEPSKNTDVQPLYQMRRKIKIFPTSIIRIELQTKSSRLYVQCINDAMIYAIETTSGIVIQTIRSTDEMHEMKVRNTFTVSPCGSLIFTKCSQEEKIKCFRITDGDYIDQIRVPHSLITKKYAVTSLNYHPTKNLIAYSILGRNIHSCLFLLCSDQEPFKKSDETYLQNEIDRHLNSGTFNFQQLQNIQSQDLNLHDIKSFAFESILNRIDDLFLLAIQSPKHADAKGQLMGMQLLLEKFSKTSLQIKDDTIQSITKSKHEIEGNVDIGLSRVVGSISSGSDGSKKSKLKTDLVEELTGKMWQMKNKNTILSKIGDSESSSSRHTFQIEKKKNSLQFNEHELSNATYSVQSDGSQQSNLTFEIQK